MEHNICITRFNDKREAVISPVVVRKSYTERNSGLNSEEFSLIYREIMKDTGEETGRKPWENSGCVSVCIVGSTLLFHNPINEKCGNVVAHRPQSTYSSRLLNQLISSVYLE